MTEVRADSNVTYRKPSGIPRLNKKLAMENAVNFTSELQNENLTNRETSNADRETYRQETCYCNNCYNKTKNLCRFTLNENLINNQGGVCEPERANNSESEDERSSISPDIEHNDFERYSETCFPNRSHLSDSESNQVPSRLYNEGIVPMTDFPYNYNKTQYSVPTRVNNNLCDRMATQFGTLHNNTNGAVGNLAMPNVCNRNINLFENKISNTSRYMDSIRNTTQNVDTFLARSRPDINTPNTISDQISSYCKYMPKHTVTMDDQNADDRNNDTDGERALMGTDNQSKIISDDNEQSVFNLLCRRASRDPFVYESKDHIKNSVYMTCLLKNDSFWKDIGTHKEDSADKSVCRTTFQNNSKVDELLHKHKTINSDALLNTLHEIFGNDSHIVEKIRNSKQPKFDDRFRNARLKNKGNRNSLEESKHCSDSNVDEKINKNKAAAGESEKLPDAQRNEEDFSSVTQSSCNDKSLAETFASALQYECCKKSSTKYCKQKTCISVKHCSCDTAKCSQLDEIHTSLTSIQSEIKMLIENMPSKQANIGNFSGEISNIKKMYEECMLYERKRSVQYKYIQKEIREIYRRLDDLGKHKRGRFFFKYFVVFPVLSVIALYSLSCLTECKQIDVEM